MIKVCSVSKTFITSEGSKNALEDISFEIKEGQCVLIGGENGSGKSLLMSIIAGLETATSGYVDSFGKRIGLVFQESDTQILGETVREDIAFGPKNLRWNKQRINEAVEKALKLTNLTEKADYPARFLSGGEKRRLAVACMVAMDNPIIIFDEPYANLDYQGVKQVNNLISLLKENGRTIIILTHEIEKCLGLTDRFIVLFHGHKVFDGSSQEAIKQDLEKWNIRNPFVCYNKVSDLIW